MFVATVPAVLADRQVRTGELKKKIKIEEMNTTLRERIEAVRTFRKQHEELQNVIQLVLGTATATSDFNAETELKNAYDHVKTIDVLDISADGQEAWRVAMGAGPLHLELFGPVEGRMDFNYERRPQACVGMWPCGCVAQLRGAGGVTRRARHS